MLPESKFLKNEIIIRNLTIGPEVTMTRKAMIRYLALSLGLIYPNESRKLILDILEALFESHFTGAQSGIHDIMSQLRANNPGELFTQNSEKAVYYHLQKLTELGLLSRKKGKYRFGEEGEQQLGLIIRRIYGENIQKVFDNLDRVVDKLGKSY